MTERQIVSKSKLAMPKHRQRNIGAVGIANFDSHMANFDFLNAYIFFRFSQYTEPVKTKIFKQNKHTRFRSCGSY